MPDCFWGIGQKFIFFAVVFLDAGGGKDSVFWIVFFGIARFGFLGESKVMRRANVMLF